MTEFCDGQHVTVLLYDWYDDDFFSFEQSGIIVRYIREHKGCIVKFDKPAIFKGNMSFSENPRNSFGRSIRTMFVPETQIIESRTTLIDKMKSIVSKFELRDSKTFKTVPQKCVDYFVFQDENNNRTVLKNTKDVCKIPSFKKRLDTRYPYYHGVTSKNCRSDMYGIDIHFAKSSRRSFNPLTFEFEDLKPEDAFGPSRAAIFCGTCSENVRNGSKVYNSWFVCSPQLAALIRILKGSEKGIKNIDKLLILPKNNKNFIIRHEKPSSRYLYYAIYLMTVKNVRSFPECWDLPKNVTRQGVIQDFSTWWSSSILKL